MLYVNFLIFCRYCSENGGEMFEWHIQKGKCAEDGVVSTY